VALDSVMHADMRPFAPFSDANPFLASISVEALQWSCVIAGVAGVAIWRASQALSYRANSRGN
jgi:hypothetical protein